MGKPEKTLVKPPDLLITIKTVKSLYFVNQRNSLVL